jgi:hypothetical protein
MVLYKYLFFLLFPFVLFNCNKQGKHQNISQEIIKAMEETQNIESIQQPEISENIHIEQESIEDNYIKKVEWDDVIEKVFVNPISKNEICYTGAYYRGDGLFWTYSNGHKTEILETYISYGPEISWHGENIAEIVIPTGSPFTHSYYYDFIEHTLSEGYDFPMYYDVDNDFILIWGDQDFELYNAKTNELVKTYDYRRINGWTPFWPFIEWNIEKENEKTIKMFWEENWINNDNGIFIFEYH